MAEIIGVASGITALLTVAVKVTELSHRYITDIRSAHTSQKQFLRELSALTQLLYRAEEAATQGDRLLSVEVDGPSTLPLGFLDGCLQELQHLRSELEKPTPTLFWPLKEKVLKKHSSSVHGLCDILSHFLTAHTLVTVSATNRDVARLGHQQTRIDLLEWLGNPADVSGSVPTPSPEAGHWFVRGESYKAWVNGTGESPVLWCNGPPGVGKSVLAAVALQHVPEDLQCQYQGQSVCVLHFFCDFASRKEQKKENIWKCLIRQAIQRGSSQLLQALTSYREKMSTGRSPSAKEFTDALLTVCATQPVVLVIDGPDELENPRDLRLILAPFMKANCRLLVMSRDLPEISSALAGAVVQQVHADKFDLTTYIMNQFEEHDMGEVLEKYPGLRDEILSKANGIFLFAKLLVDHLLDLLNVKEMKRALSSYPAHLDEAFQSTIDRINAQSKSHSLLAHRVLGWVTFAERKLRVDELIHGIAAEYESSDIEEDSLIPSKTVLKVCRGLMVADPKDGTVSLVHKTAYEWFRTRDASRHHEDLSRSCLRYLTLRSLSTGPAASVEEMDQRIAKLPFLLYAAQNWRKHATATTEIETKLSGVIRDLFDDDNLRNAAFQASNYNSQLKHPEIKSTTFESIPKGQSALHIAAFWDLPEVVLTLIQAGHDVNSVDSQNWTPLHWACYGNSQGSASALIEHQADTEAKDSVGWTPLFWACVGGTPSLVKSILKGGASHLERDVHDWTPLRWAVARHNTDVIEILLKHHTKIQEELERGGGNVSTTTDIDDALHFDAMRNNQGQVLGVLLEQSIDACSDIGFVDLYSTLLDKSVDLSTLWPSGAFDPPTGNSWRTLSKAERMYGGIQHYIDVDYRRAKSDNKRSVALLHSAIKDSNISAVRVLLEVGVDVNAYIDLRRTSLHVAAFRKDPKFASLLIDHGAGLEATDDHGLTPLQQAVMNGFEDTASLLLDRGANANAIYEPLSKLPSSVCKGGQKSPLMLTSGLDFIPEAPSTASSMATLLLKHGADVNLTMDHKHGMAVVHFAACSRDPDLLRVIIDARADCYQLDKDGRTVFHHLVLGNRRRRTTSKTFDLGRTAEPSKALQCLALLVQKTDGELFNQTASWTEQSRGYYKKMKSIHTPMSLAFVFEDWDLFYGLHRLCARFKSNVPMQNILLESLQFIQEDVIDIILENGVAFNKTPEDDMQSRDFSVLSGPLSHEESTRLQSNLAKLVSRGFDINTRFCKLTLLQTTMSITYKDSFDLVRTLLDLGADSSLENDEGLDVMLMACLNANWGASRVILQHLQNHPVTGHWTQHIDDSRSTERDGEILDIVCAALSAAGLLENPGDKDVSSNATPDTLLCQATRHGNVLFVEHLLKHKADPNLSGRDGERPLYIAAENGHAQIAKSLINFGGEVDIRNKIQKTPLHAAAHKSHEEMVDLLLSQGASPYLATEAGWTPLHFAAHWGHEKVVLSLIKSGASVKAKTTHLGRDAYGRRPSRLGSYDSWTATPLHCAAMSANVEITRLLLEQSDIDVNARSGFFEYEDVGRERLHPVGGTALRIALDTGLAYGLDGHALDEPRLRIALMLVEAGASTEGVANHLKVVDLVNFKKVPDLWEKLRQGITVSESS